MGEIKTTIMRFKLNGQGTVVTFEDRFASARSIDHFGQYSLSKDKKYAVSWSSGEGYKSNGYVLLIKDAKVLGKISLPRPLDAKISNTSIIAVDDCRFTNKQGTNMKSIFYLLNDTLEIIYKHQTSALIGTIAVSENGKYAAYMTYGGKCNDANTLFLIDVPNSSLLFKTKPKAAYPDFIVIDETSEILTLSHHQHRNISDVNYDLTGCLLNAIC